MKKLVFTLLLVFSMQLVVNAQNETANPEIGDVFVVNAPDGTNYNHIYFPKLNFLVKKGKLANYKSVHNTKVVVKDVMDKNGNTYVTLAPQNGDKFFGYLSKVKANFTESMNSGELSTVNSNHNRGKNQGEIASL